jgi:hypothetical protein
MQLTSAIAAIVAVGIAVLSVVMLRNVQGAAHGDAPSEPDGGLVRAGESQGDAHEAVGVAVAPEPC